MNGAAAKKLITKAGLPVAPWRRKLPPTAAWFNDEEGSDWALSSSFWISRRMIGFTPDPDVLLDVEHRWAMVLDDHAEMLALKANVKRCSGDPDAKAIITLARETLTELRRYKAMARSSDRAIHPGAFQAGFASLLKAASHAYVCTKAGAPRHEAFHSPALLVDRYDALLAVVMPVRLEHFDTTKIPNTIRGIHLVNSSGVLFEHLNAKRGS